MVRCESVSCEGVSCECKMGDEYIMSLGICSAKVGSCSTCITPRAIPHFSTWYAFHGGCMVHVCV